MFSPTIYPRYYYFERNKKLANGNPDVIHFGMFK